MSPINPPALSVLVPVFNEEGNAGSLCVEILEVLQNLALEGEVIFVNDGSTDGTLVELRAIAAHEPRLRILDLDGNFGEAAALSAGFHAARGERVVTLDGDGQNDPHDIPSLLAALGGGVDVVSGWRQRRQEDLLARILPSRIANHLIRLITGLPVHDCGCGLKVYRRGVLGAMQLPRGMHRFLPAILGVEPNQVAEVRVRDRRRQHGTSHYGLTRTLAVLRDLAVLPFLIRAPGSYERAFAIVSAGGLTASVLLALLGRLLLSIVIAGVMLFALMNWWNLRRFNRAQRMGVYRVRAEYPRVERSNDATR
jgi:glycosyltransferase involved in cell wall biosynthesis